MDLPICIKGARSEKNGFLAFCKHSCSSGTTPSSGSSCVFSNTKPEFPDYLRAILGEHSLSGFSLSWTWGFTILLGGGVAALAFAFTSSILGGETNLLKKLYIISKLILTLKSFNNQLAKLLLNFQSKNNFHLLLSLSIHQLLPQLGTHVVALWTFLLVF